MRITVRMVKERFLTEIFRLGQVAWPEVSSNLILDWQEVRQSTKRICQQKEVPNEKSRIKQM